MKLTDITKTQFIFLLLCLMRLANGITAIVQIFKPNEKIDDFSDLIHKLKDWLTYEEEEGDDI